VGQATAVADPVAGYPTTETYSVPPLRTWMSGLIPRRLPARTDSTLRPSPSSPGSQVRD
jgi:hypothetical protein